MAALFSIAASVLDAGSEVALHGVGNETRPVADNW